MLVSIVLFAQIHSVLAFWFSPEAIGTNGRSRQPLTNQRSKIAINKFSPKTHLFFIVPEIDELSTLSSPSSSVSDMSSILLASDVESWRQYVPLVVSVGVIIDILLGSPLANLALGPMKRASEKGSGEDSNSTGAGGGESLFSAFGNGNVGGESKSKERVDSEAIAQAAIDKARNTLELKRFLEENKTNEQKYDEIRRKIDKQMNDLDES